MISSWKPQWAEQKVTGDVLDHGLDSKLAVANQFGAAMRIAEKIPTTR